MAFKDVVNSALSRTTGYRISRDAESDRADMLREVDAETDRRISRLRARHRKQRREMAREIRKRTREVEQLRRQAARRKARLPTYVDDTVREIIEKSAPRTLTGPEKLWPLIEAVRYVADHDIPGAIVECGVWRGGSMQAMAWTLLDRGVSDRELHLYDTFEGMSEPTEHDFRIRTGAMAADLLAEGKAKCEADLDDVREGMVELGYPIERIHFHEGKVEDTIPDQAPEQIAVLRLDTDWYESTKHELEHLYSRLSPGGVLIIDDFGSWDGARKATLEWLEESDEPLLLVPIGAARIAVKALSKP